MKTAHRKASEKAALNTSVVLKDKRISKTETQRNVKTTRGIHIKIIRTLKERRKAKK